MRSLRSVSALALALAAFTAQAQITTLSLADWRAAVASPTTFDFVGLTPGTLVSNAYAAQGVTFVNAVAQSGPNYASYFPTDGAGFAASVSALGVSLSSPVSAIAFQGTGSPRSVSFLRGGVLVGSASFLSTVGYVSSAPFDQVTFVGGVGNTPTAYIDNVILANPTPEPSALVALGLGAFVAFRRRCR